MRFPKRFPFLLAGAIALTFPAASPADVTYPPGTTIEEAWLGPPQIEAGEAAARIASHFLAQRASGSEPELGPLDFEAMKYLVGNHEQAREEPPAQAGMRRFGGEIAPENMTGPQLEFFGALSLALADGLGLTAVEAPDLCVAQKRLWEVTKYKYDIGWNEVEVWGLSAFGHNVQYGANHSDLVYGLFPFGVRMSWWDALKCSFDRPDDEEGLRACGRAQEWKIHGESSMSLQSSYEHVVPGVAQASLTWAGALYSGEADQFRTNEQTRDSLNPTWLLGPSNTPLPSDAVAAEACVGTGSQCPHGPAMSYRYRFSRVLAWWPNIVLNASYNNLVPQDLEIFRYSGKGDGNPHGLGSWQIIRPFSRFHQPLPGCN